MNIHAFGDNYFGIKDHYYSLSRDLMDRGIPFPKFRVLQKVELIDQDLMGEIRGICLYSGYSVAPEPSYHWAYEVLLENSELLEYVEETEMMEVNDG